MIISHSKQFMFLHNPKSAGTSVRRALFQYDENPLRLEYQKYIPDLERCIELFHVCAADFHAVWGDEFEHHFKFGFVRNPYTRLFSSWDEYRRQHPDMRDEDFNVWARGHLTRANLRYDWEYTHFCPQHYFFYKGNKNIADYIGKQENLAQEWKTICRLLKIPHRELGHEKDFNKYELPDRLSMDKIAEDVLLKVNALYEMDFLLFGYEMVGPEPKRGRHLDWVDAQTHPFHYDPRGDVRNMNLTDQCAFWRATANTLAHKLVANGIDCKDVPIEFHKV